MVVFQRLRERLPRINFFFQRVGITLETLTERQREMMEKYREGMARALGVPPGAIKPGIVERWILGWTRAFVSPEYWKEIVVEW